MKSLKKLTILILMLFLFFNCKQTPKNEQFYDELDSKISSSEETLYRPNFHFTPKKGWMNDPNGMFYYNGKYHLYFQHYPDDNVWGPMHWGHAISKDMITWEEQPIAIFPDDKGYIFSGSAVVDVNNTSGFGKEGKTPIIAMFTYHNMEGEKAGKTDYQTQAIAYSLDEGQTFTKYSENSVIKNPGIKDFRDPKIVWDDIHKKWLMVLAAGQEIMFYSSLNLKDWKLESDFGDGFGAHGGVWECPDFFPIKVQGSNELKWVLFVSINPGGPNGGSATQYFVGDFDGKQFKLDATFENDLNASKHKSIWVDYGKDNYAGVTWSNIPDADGRKLFIGWMSNWEYANVVPTETWRSAMSLARQFELHKKDDSYKILSQPVNELSKYKISKIKNNAVLVKGETMLTNINTVNLASAEINFTISDLKDNVYTFKISNSKGDELVFGYNHFNKNFFIDRSKAGKTSFSKSFANTISIAPRTSKDRNLSGKIVLDKTSIELFFDKGETVMTELFFLNAPFETLSIYSDNEEFKLDVIEIQQLNFN